MPTSYASIKQAESAAKAASLENPGKYVTIYACFGLFLKIESRLHKFAPSDSITDGYWLNGKRKRFTNAQKAMDWNSTPALS